MLKSGKYHIFNHTYHALYALTVLHLSINVNRIIKYIKTMYEFNCTLRFWDQNSMPMTISEYFISGLAQITIHET